MKLIYVTWSCHTNTISCTDNFHP